METGKVVAVIGGVALLGAGAYLILRSPPGKKHPGDTLTASIRLRHKGPKDKVWVGFGLAEHRAVFGGAPILTWFYQEVDVPAHAVPTFLTAPKLQATVPALAGPGEYDALLFVQVIGGPLRDYRDVLAYTVMDKALTLLEG